MAGLLWSSVIHIHVHHIEAVTMYEGSLAVFRIPGRLEMRWASSKAIRPIFFCWPISRKTGSGWPLQVKKLSGVVKRRRSFPALSLSTTSSLGWPAPK